jgi:hypothetical protein
VGNKLTLSRPQAAIDVGKEPAVKLLTTLYNEVHPERAQELVTCLERNAANPWIDEIHVFYDASAGGRAGPVRQALDRSEARLRETNGRPTYGDFFRYAQEELADEIVILANADIHFDQTLAQLSRFDWQGVLLAITRDDFVGTESEGSSDAWIFRAPLPLFGESVTFGTICCDQVISFLALKQGLRVENPCLSIRCTHLHQSQVRNRPGTSQHRPEQSSSSDGLKGMGERELMQRLAQEHGISLMTFSALGGGMIWPSTLVADPDEATGLTTRCRKVPRWQPVRRSVRQIRRAIKRRVGQAFLPARKAG